MAELRKLLVQEEDTVHTSPSSCRMSKNCYALSSHSQKVTVLLCVDQLQRKESLTAALDAKILESLVDDEERLKLKCCKLKKFTH